jgi:hypothetical protein
VLGVALILPGVYTCMALIKAERNWGWSGKKNLVFVLPFGIGISTASNLLKNIFLYLKSKKIAFCFAFYGVRKPNRIY